MDYSRSSKSKSNRPSTASLVVQSTRARPLDRCARLVSRASSSPRARTFPRLPVVGADFSALAVVARRAEKSAPAPAPARPSSPGISGIALDAMRLVETRDVVRARDVIGHRGYPVM